jgi:hypothetical protein
MAPYRYRVALASVNEVLGPISDLDDVVVGVRWTYPGLTLLEHDAHGQFVIFGVPDEIAERWDCASVARSGSTAPPENMRPGGSYEDFNYFVASVYINGLAGGGGLNLLWGREDDYWKIISYESDPEPPNLGTMPDTRPADEATLHEAMQAPSGLLTAVDAFTESWSVTKDMDTVMASFSPRVMPCVNLFVNPDEEPLTTPQDRENRLRLGMGRTSTQLGAVQRLEDVIEGVDPDWDALPDDTPPRLGVVLGTAAYMSPTSALR